ncbi:Mss4-like protein [Neocallimastix lanati (nom. inval.)]|uniref:Mss4-like protein n=1 Tax=Neocallimastix californiae TaxID=1754190 RepID=A0A1Y1ZHG4_9FUNG|nr:Mss4-like protein [Neocallimastix sp. JGI-2020a]ORY09708.1 Mss4-like protein [Neocallimastix californiae]|eukprot:ORY09708.1 Mss4-like protein [Neocallimastix californiae]
MVEYLLYKDATKVDLIEKESNKNSKNIYCPVCNCIVLLKNMVIANESKDEFTFSVPLPGNNDKMNFSEESPFFWEAANQFTFENVGVSKISGDGKRYLSCANCDFGPIGKIENQTKYLISADRVRYNK